MKGICCISVFILMLGSMAITHSLNAAAPETLPVRVANLSEDLTYLAKEVAQLRLEIETLNRENRALQKQIDSIQLCDNRLKILESKQEAQVASMESFKKVLLTQVSEELESFSKQTQKAMDQLAKSFATKPAPEALKFSDDYSKEGVAYTVKPGDSLSLIAQKQGSTVRDIQNANRIVDPRELKAGQVIFIPTKKQ